MRSALIWVVTRVNMTVDLLSNEIVTFFLGYKAVLNRLKNGSAKNYEA